MSEPADDLEHRIRDAVSGLLREHVALVSERESGIVAQALDQHRRECESEESAVMLAEKRRGASKAVAGLGGGILAVIGAIYAYGHQQATSEANTKARAVEVDGQIEDVRRETKAATDAVRMVAEKLDRHIDQQALVNEAAAVRGARQEIMLEQLVERRGMKPPRRLERVRRAETAALGFDPESQVRRR